MPLSTRNTKLILRIGVMVMAALTLGLAVRLVLENRELEKLLPATSTRTLLLIAAPLTSLVMLHLIIAVRTLGVRALTIEIVYLLGESALFIAIVSPLLVGSWVSITVEPCGRWLRACPDDLLWIPLWGMQPVGFTVSVVLIVGATVHQIRRSKNHRSASESRYLGLSTENSAK